MRKPDLKQVASLALWALALNFAWEMLQAPLFVGMLEMPAWDATKRCLQATFGDAMMILIAFAAVGLARRDWGWIQRPSSSALSAFWLLAAGQALALEWLFLRMGRWSYDSAMPVDPLFGLRPCPNPAVAYRPPGHPLGGETHRRIAHPRPNSVSFRSPRATEWVAVMIPEILAPRAEHGRQERGRVAG